jgi:hypothetical protein
MDDRTLMAYFSLSWTSWADHIAIMAGIAASRERHVTTYVRGPRRSDGRDRVKKRQLAWT